MYFSVKWYFSLVLVMMWRRRIDPLSIFYQRSLLWELLELLWWKTVLLFPEATCHARCLWFKFFIEVARIQLEASEGQATPTPVSQNPTLCCLNALHSCSQKKWMRSVLTAHPVETYHREGPGSLAWMNYNAEQEDRAGSSFLKIEVTLSNGPASELVGCVYGVYGLSFTY